MKKIILLTLVMVFLWAGVSFAENWIIFFEGSHLKTFFDADRVFKSGNGFDYWELWEWIPPLNENKYYVRHMQLELRSDKWWQRKIESWFIDTHGKKSEIHPGQDWYLMKGEQSPSSKALLDGLRKYAR